MQMSPSITDTIETSKLSMEESFVEGSFSIIIKVFKWEKKSVHCSELHVGVYYSEVSFIKGSTVLITDAFIIVRIERKNY